MSSSFLDTNGNPIDPEQVTQLDWTYTPNTKAHQVLNQPANGSVVTNVGVGALTGTFGAICDQATAQLLSQAALYGCQFIDESHVLNEIVTVATSPITVTQDQMQRQYFLVSWQWVELT